MEEIVGVVKRDQTYLFKPFNVIIRQSKACGAEVVIELIARSANR
jgi:hypothetical protein